MEAHTVESLVNDNIKLVYHVINNERYLPPRGMDKDDLFQIGCMGLLRAAKEFDPSKGYTFGTYGYLLIKHELIREIKKAKRDKRKANMDSISLNQEIGHEVEPVFLLDTLIDDQMVEAEVEYRWLLESVINLDPVIMEPLSIGYTQKEIAKMHGYSHTWSWKRVVKVRKRMMVCGYMNVLG